MADATLQADIEANTESLRDDLEDEEFEVGVTGDSQLEQDTTGGTGGGGGGGLLAGGGKALAILGGILAFVSQLDVIVEVVSALLSVISFALAPVAASLTKQLVPLLLQLVQGITDFLSDPIGTLRTVFETLGNVLVDSFSVLLSRLPIIGDNFNRGSSGGRGSTFSNNVLGLASTPFLGPAGPAVGAGANALGIDLAGQIDVTVESSENFITNVVKDIRTRISSLT